MIVINLLYNDGYNDIILLKNLTRRNRKPISYKITKTQVNTALDLLKQNEQLTMNELAVDMKNKYPTFDITSQHLGHMLEAIIKPENAQDTNIFQMKDTRNR